jgi:hypothetical protein
MEARARVIPRTPNAEMTEMIAAMIRTSTMEKPSDFRFVKLAFIFCIPIVVVQSELPRWSRLSLTIAALVQERCHKGSSKDN